MDAQSLQYIVQLARAGQLLKAQELAEGLLKTHENEPAILDICSVIALELAQPEKALNYSKKAIALVSKNAIYYYRAGLAYSALEQFDNAIHHYQSAITIQPQLGPAHLQLANTLAGIKSFEKAENHYQLAIANGVLNAALFNNLANVLSEQTKMDEAIQYYRQSLQTDPKYYQASFNLANALYKKRYYQEALNYFYETLRLSPQHTEAPYFIGLTLTKLGNHDSAIQFLNTITSSIKTAKIFILLGNIYLKQMNFSQAIIAFKQGLKFFPDDIELLADLLMTLKKSCAWDEMLYWQSILTQKIKDILHSDTAFPLLNYYWLGLNLVVKEHVILAKKIAAYHFSSLKTLRSQLQFEFKKQAKTRLKIGYVSGDLRDHATAHLIKNMFRFHDREHVEISLYSIGPSDQSHYKDHIIKQCDHFIDLFQFSVDECAKRIYQDKIDILVDMMGYTEHSKAGIFALKPAPIQISYLGYPCTTGMQTMDYIIADRLLLPFEWVETTEAYEKIIFMPDTTFITDDQQEISDQPSTRSAYGLPEQDFIFCCFNNSYKIDSNVFKVWMEILQEVPNSVLWLYSQHYLAETNLKNEAKKQQVNADRLIFAHKLPKKEHLARLKHADLSLDCSIINAGTTAIDSLWAGVPIIGYESSNNLRIASSILSAIGLPELIVKSEQQYKDLAIFYATHPQSLTELRKKIITNKDTFPLFKPARFVTNLEKAYQQVWQNYLAEKTEHVFID